MKKFIPIACLVALLISSCAPVYIPNARNAPLLTKAGEFQGNIQFGNGIDAQGAVAVTNHIGLMGNFSYADNKSPDPNDIDDYHRHKFFEGGIGYFENDGKWCYEVFAGYGRGEGSSYDTYDFWSSNGDPVKATGKFERYFIQPAFGLNKKVMHVAFVPRIALVDFNEFVSEDNPIAPYVANDDPKVFIEPAVIGKVNLMNNHMFFTFQAGFSIPVTKTYYEYRPFYVSTGIGFRIGGLKKEVAATE